MPAYWNQPENPRYLAPSGVRRGAARPNQAASAYCVLAVESLHPFYVAGMLHDTQQRIVVVRSKPVGPVMSKSNATASAADFRIRVYALNPQE